MCDLFHICLLGLSVVSGLSGCISLVELSLAYNEVDDILCDIIYF